MSKQDTLFDEGKKLPLVEQFYTIQGEGYHTGKPAYFIRIGGCDIGCKWCDTKFSWNSDLHPLVDTDMIVKKVSECKAKALVVTGGEPLLYQLDYLCDELKKHGVKTFLETSGSRKVTGKWDWICFSPKKQSPPDEGIFAMAHELKVIIDENLDFAWAEENAKKVNDSCKLYLQPEWSLYETIIHDLVDFVKDNPQWNISLQSHKFMHIP